MDILKQIDIRYSNNIWVSLELLGVFMNEEKKEGLEEREKKKAVISYKLAMVFGVIGGLILFVLGTMGSATFYLKLIAYFPISHIRWDESPYIPLPVNSPPTWLA